MPQQVQEMYRECGKRGDEQIRQLIAQFNALAENYDDMNFTAQSLSTITARTLVVHGDCDRFFPVDIPVSISCSIPDAALWIIPGGEHAPIYVPSFHSPQQPCDSLMGQTASCHQRLNAPPDRYSAGAR